MNRYQLAKIVQWAGTLRTRKKVQKIVYLLQSAGCTIDVEYSLHHFGPYSEDVATTTNEMVQAGLLVESRSENMAGQQFDYSLSEAALQGLQEFESSTRGKERAIEMKAFEPIARELLSKDVRVLEMAATMIYFYGQEKDWNKSVEYTATFKRLPLMSPTLAAAEPLAKSILKQ